MSDIIRGRGKKESLFKPTKTHEHIRGAATPRSGDLPQGTNNSSLDEQAGGTKDQVSSPWCTGFTLSEVLAYAYVGQTGVPIDLSAMFSYIGGKLIENQLAGLANTAPINDDGADFSNLIMAAMAQGVCLDSLMPFRPDLLQQKENYVQIADANQRKVRVGAFGSVVGATDEAYINALCQSLLPYPDGKIGATVPIGIASSYPDFDNADGTTILVSPPQAAGLQIDHEVEDVDYYTVIAVNDGVVTLSNGQTRKDPTGTVKVGDRSFRVKNHWSKNWCPLSDIPGTLLVHQSFMVGQRTLGGDAYALNIEVSP